MQSLTATLLAAQKSLERPPLLKVVLTKSGQATQTFDANLYTNTIINLNHIEQEWNQVLYFSVQSDPTLAALDLHGYTGIASYGYNTSAGDEYKDKAPLEVLAQHTVTDFRHPQLVLITSFSLGGVFNFMMGEKAKSKYALEDDDVRTVKALLIEIAEATLPPFVDSKAYTITFDSEDSLIDSYAPADYFYVSNGEDRLSAFRKLLKTTKCKARIEADGAIHIFNPTVSGTSYDYEFNDAVTNHNFFEKGVRERLVIPNKIVVSSAESHTTQFTGEATDSASFNALGRYITDAPFHIRATSDAQCTAIAEAMIQHKQVDAEKGHGTAPMNAGQEVGDWIKITDSIASDTRVGNIGYLERIYKVGKKLEQEFRFGALPDAMELAIGVTEGELSAQTALNIALDTMRAIEAEKMREYILQKLWVTKQLRIPEGIYDGD